MQIEENVPIAPLTTIGIGGPARYFVGARSVDEIREALDWARSRRVEVFILGGGSNLLVSDEGFDGLVVGAHLRGITLIDEDRYANVNVAAGERWDAFVAHAVTRGWSGIECLSGIPGSVGATPIQNVGAYGQEVSETVIRVEALDRATGTVRWLTNEECGFGYRSSIFKTSERGRYVVVSATFRLERGGAATLRYPELRRDLEGSGIAPDDLLGVRETVIAIRRRKGMVLDPEDPDTRSDGSFFMNPVLTGDEYARFRALAPEAPHFPSDAGVKLSAAWLIERAGFERGYALGRAGLSTKHTLAIVNRGGATAREVLALVRLIQAGVRERFGIDLHPEPELVGRH